MRKRSEKRTRSGEIRHYRRVYTHRTQESLVGHKGRGIEERVDSWVLQQVPHSILVRRYIHHFNYLALALVSCVHNAVSYTYEQRGFSPLVNT